VPRLQTTLAALCGAYLLVALSTVAFAQVKPADLECKTTETQAECHARLKCGPYEELEECKKRLLKCKPGEDLSACKKRVNDQGSGQSTGNQGGNQGNDNQRGDERGGGDDRGDRGDRGDDRGDRGRGDDRGDRGRNDDRGSRDRGDDNGRRRRRRDDRGDSRGRGERGGHGFEANKTFGLGLELGAPTGLTGKYFVKPSGALDFGAGYIYRYYYYDDGLHLYLDYLWHPVSLVSADAFELPFYVGVGARYWDFDYCEGPAPTCYGGSAIGLRVPLGLAFDFNRVPLDIFFQLIPVFDFVRGPYRTRFDERNHFGIDFSFGIRFWFK
jgi:hypothetical protein